jgi:hypothetical protein
VVRSKSRFARLHEKLRFSTAKHKLPPLVVRRMSFNKTIKRRSIMWAGSLVPTEGYSRLGTFTAAGESHAASEHPEADPAKAASASVSFRSPRAASDTLTRGHAGSKQRGRAGSGSSIGKAEQHWVGARRRQDRFPSLQLERSAVLNSLIRNLSSTITAISGSPRNI